MSAPVFAATKGKFFVDGTPGEIGVSINWAPTDPCCVTFTFHETDDTVEIWDVSRELLRKALASNEFVGAGDVLLGGKLDNAYLSVVLYPEPNRKQTTAHVLIPRINVEWLLAASIAQCPINSAAECRAVEAAIDYAVTEILRTQS